jgi:CheY-like chemotaxis protein
MTNIPAEAGGDETRKTQSDDARLESHPARPVNSGGSKHVARNLWLMKKTVLLIDVDSTSREARSKVMRALGVTVHCAATVTGARQKLESGSYNLILVDLGSEVEAAKAFVEEIRTKNPRQLVAFLVGSPLFVATSLDGQPVAQPKARAPRTEPVHKADPPASSVFDFGQKIRDAEASRS